MDVISDAGKPQDSPLNEVLTKR